MFATAPAGLSAPDSLAVVEQHVYVGYGDNHAADGGPFGGTLDMSTGIITPIVTGLNGPGGLIFVDTSEPHPPQPSTCDK